MRERVCWDDYYMIAALWAKTRSPDESTQHGCVIVAQGGEVLSWGYNGFPRGCDDKLMPQTRPEKYSVILHSEENAILNCNVLMDGATVYVTGPPCVKCWPKLIQKGIKKVVYGPVYSTSPDSEHLKDDDLIALMLKDRDIEIVKWEAKDWGLIRDELDDIISRLMKLVLGKDDADVATQI